MLGTREGRREVYRDITTRAGYDLLPAASWLVLRMRKYGWVEPALLAERTSVPLGAIIEGARQVEERGLATRQGLDLLLTEPGQEVAARLAAAREASLGELLGDWWGPDRPTDLAQLVKDLNDELCGSDREQPHEGPAARL